MQGVPRGWFSRSRPLSHYDGKFGEGRVRSTIEAALVRQSDVAVLEIGCGEGRVLMELLKLFPTLALYGMNREPWPAMQGSESLRETAVYYEVFSPTEAAALTLPTIVFGDAATLPFDAATFDVIISQVTTPYVVRKDWMLAEVWRTLKPGGMAFLHIDSTRDEESDLLCGDAPTFVVYEGTRRIALAEVFASLRAAGFDVGYQQQRHLDGTRDKWHFSLVMRKNNAAALELGLTLDQQSSFDLTRLHRSPADWGSLWGYRSVFQRGPARSTGGRCPSRRRS